MSVEYGHITCKTVRKWIAPSANGVASKSSAAPDDFKPAAEVERRGSQGGL